jgi:hypothetical protein
VRVDRALDHPIPVALDRAQHRLHQLLAQQVRLEAEIEQLGVGRGAVAAKVLIVRSRRFPGWTLPLAGGSLVALIAILWYTSALWYFDNYSLPAL